MGKINYYTSKKEIKPQQFCCHGKPYFHYYTSKKEIKPQRGIVQANSIYDYYTSKKEIKPQHSLYIVPRYNIIIHQKKKSNHNAFA